MSLSKRMRFEIMRRDGHACRYCGSEAPEVKLVVDHVTPVALGGTDEPENLVTACQDCNSGKASVSPDADVLADIQADSAAWKRAKEQATLRPSLYRGFNEEITDFDMAWCDWRTKEAPPRAIPRPDEWRVSVRQWLLRDFSIEDILSCIPIALTREGVQLDDRWRYFCGVVWNHIKEWELAVEEEYQRQKRQR